MSEIQYPYQRPMFKIQYPNPLYPKLRSKSMKTTCWWGRNPTERKRSGILRKTSGWAGGFISKYYT